MRSYAYAVMCWLLVFTAPAVAQDQAFLRMSPNKEETQFVFRQQTAEVAVQLAVVDRQGRAVSGIREDDLLVFDNGRQVSEVTGFGPNNELPLRIALVIDWSDSMRKWLERERNGARDFLSAVLRPNRDEALVIGFGAKPQVTQQLTDDFEQLEKGIHPIPGTQLTAVYDAVVAGCDQLRKGSSLEPQRRVLLLLSDGFDNYSLVGMGDAIEEAQRYGISIYAITPDGMYQHDTQTRRLLALTSQTGGRVVGISKRMDVAFRQIETELRSGYSLYFKPAPVETGSVHSLRVLPRNRNLQVRARAAYYAQWK